MTITPNIELPQFRDITLSKNFYYSRSTPGSELFNNEHYEEGNPCAQLRDYGSLMFHDVLPDEAPSAVIVEIHRKDEMRAKPEIAIVFKNGDTLIGLMCEVCSGTYDKAAQAISRNPALLAKLFGAFDNGLEGTVSIPRQTMIYKRSTTITFNAHRNEIELNRYKKED